MSASVVRSSSFALRIALLLFWLAALRCFYVVLHDPMLGYGNQFDMGRTAACVNLWPERAGGLRDEAYWQGPIAKHRIAEIKSQACYPSAEVALAAVAMVLDPLRRVFVADSAFDMRTLGVLKVLLLFAVGWAVHRSLQGKAWAAVTHAAVLALVLADPVSTLFFNTLYSEYVAVIGVYACIASLAAFAINSRLAGDGKPDRALSVVFLFGVTLLAFSRMQHVLLPMFFWCFFAAQRWVSGRWSGLRRAWQAVTFALVAVILGVVIHVDANRRIPAFREVNRHDALFWAMLPAADEPARIARRLGLSEQCAKLAYASFYRKLGRDLNALCPEAVNVSLLRLGWVAITEPNLSRTMWLRGIQQSSAWRLAYVGEIEGGEFARVGLGPISLTASTSTLAVRASFLTHAVFWIVPVGAGLFVLCWLGMNSIRRRDASNSGRDHQRMATATAVFGLSGVIVSVWASAVLGDGYSEMARHAHLGIIAALAAWVVLVAAFVQWRWRTAFAVAVILCASAMLMTQRVSVAAGELREPLTDSVLANAVTAASQPLRGWVLTPYTVVAVELDVNGATVARTAVTPSSAMALHHPIHGNRSAIKFSFPPDTLSKYKGADAAVELFAVNANGKRERFDRRYFCSVAFACAQQ
jgi:hypothetical protein